MSEPTSPQSDLVQDVDEEINVEMLITEVEKRPGLYDKSLKQHNIKQKLWGEVCQSLFSRWRQIPQKERIEKVKAVQSKWRNLKDRFTKEVAIQKHVQVGQSGKKKRKYYYYDNLLFLMPSIGQRENINRENTEQMPERESQDMNTVLDMPSNSRSNNQSYQKKKWKPEFEDQVIDILKRATDVDDFDEDKHFSLMLIPMMRKLNEEQKYFAKTEILRVMRQARNLDSMPSESIDSIDYSATNPLYIGVKDELGK